jgi:hypothetical protein
MKGLAPVRVPPFLAMRKYLLALLLSGGVFTFVDGQHISPSYREADTVWLDQLLYNGVEWRPGFATVTGHEFFLGPGFLTGSVTVEGILFNNVQLKYDIFNDKLVIRRGNSKPIVMSNEKVDAFTISDSGTETKFFNLRNTGPEVSGFAEVIYQGKSSVIARHTKVIAKNASLTSYAQFREYTRFYLVTGATCSQIRNRSSFLKLLGSREPAVKRYIRQNNLFMSSSSPYGFGVAAAYYDSLEDVGMPD